jgi:hypothetical protein
VSRYLALIEGTRLIDHVASCTTTGDVAYPGTALEIADPDGKGLFHVVVDGSGQRQVLFFAAPENYRMPLELLEQIIAGAKQTVAPTKDEP